MSLSIVIPVFNEIDQLKITLKKLDILKNKIKKIEIIFIDDFSKDKTFNFLKTQLKKKNYMSVYRNKKKGLGSAIQLGILKSKNDYICLMACDLSDDFKDIRKYYEIISKNKLDAVFGSRFTKNSQVINYPLFKLILNRIFNNVVKIIFLTNYNDFTNGFKIYKRKTLLLLFPIVSESFNVFLELPLKIISRKFKYQITNINYYNRTTGLSKFRIRELGSMYLFTLLYCFIEKLLLKK
jgi:dolichol-phosphate mannosyltransferase